MAAVARRYADLRDWAPAYAGEGKQEGGKRGMGKGRRKRPAYRASRKATSLMNRWSSPAANHDTSAAIAPSTSLNGSISALV